MSEDPKPSITRRDFLREGGRGLALVSLGALGTLAAQRARGRDSVWQIDPYRCTRCGKCETHCVLSPSAVKCFRDIPLCGYCWICTGYQAPRRLDEVGEQAENQICPTGAISRTWVKEGDYCEYLVDRDKCIGCGKCVEGCTKFSNGSMYLQVFHDRCLNCAVCTISRACPAQAFVRVPNTKPYLLKSERHPRKKGGGPS